MGTTLTIDQSTKSYQTFWTVPAAGTYTLQITSADPAASEVLHWYYLTVWKAKDGTPVLKAVDMLRSVDFLYRYVRAEPTVSANTLTISHTGGSDKSSLFSMDSGSQFTLPSLAKGDIVNIRLDFPDLIASANPKTFEMRLLSSSGSDIYNQPLPMGTTLTIDQSTKSYQTFWTVPAAGTYTLQITSADPAASEVLHWYYLTVWKAKDGTPVLKAVDMLRSVDFLYRYVRAEPTVSANTLTISHTGGSDKSSLFSMDSGSQFTLSALETASAFENTNTYTVSTGYYLAKYSITLGTSADLGYESKAYPCPYHSDYSDLRGIFKPCSATTPSNTFTIPATTGNIFGDSLLQLADQSDARPTHDLGALSQG